MNHWLIKSEPTVYSWTDFENKGRDQWEGVRNFKARNHIMQMKMGDTCLFYHSVKEKSIVGIAEVVGEYYPDPTAEDPRWYVMDIKPVRKLKRPVSLAEVKLDSRLSKMQLVTHPRLSVQIVQENEYDIIIEKSEQ